MEVTARRARGGARADASVTAFSANEDDARELAENKLKEMYAALSQRFAPVLRWRPVIVDGVETGIMRGTFDVEKHHPMATWMLKAWSGAFELGWEHDAKWTGMKGASVQETMSAAEAELRGLGVNFRVAGDAG